MINPMKPVIYKIKNKITGKIYIGQTIDYVRRLSQYKHSKAKGQPKLFRSIIKYGFNNHTFSIIECCDACKLDEREVYWIEYYDSYHTGLNGSLGGEKNTRGIKWSTLSVFKSISKVYKCDTDGNIITVYYGLKIAAEREKTEVKYYGGRNITSNGFVFLSESQINTVDFDEIKKRFEKKDDHRRKPVAQIDKTGKVIKIFKGVREACRITKIDHRSIAAVAGGSKIRKTAGGYFWQYKKEVANVA